MKRQKGLTLLELLIAVAVFAIMAALAYGGLNTVLASRDQVEKQSSELAGLQKAFFRINRDISQVVARGIRDGFGDVQDAMRDKRGQLVDKEDLFEFTRTGRFNPTGQPRSYLQRIAYGVEDNKLIRYSWNVLDRAQDSEPAKYVLLEKIKRVELRFLDAQGQWQTHWPVSGDKAVPPDPQAFATKKADSQSVLPLAVEITIELEQLGKIVRIVRIS